MDPLGIAFIVGLIGFGLLAHVSHLRQIARLREALEALGREPGFTYVPSSNGKGTGLVRGTVDGVPVEITVDTKRLNTTYQVRYESGAPWFELLANPTLQTQDPEVGEVVYNLVDRELELAYTVSAYEPEVRQALTGRPAVRDALLELAHRRRELGLPQTPEGAGCVRVTVLTDRAYALLAGPPHPFDRDTLALLVRLAKAFSAPG